MIYIIVINNPEPESTDDVYTYYSKYIDTVSGVEVLIDCKQGELYRKGLVKTPDYSCKVKYIRYGDTNVTLQCQIESENGGEYPIFSGYHINNAFYMDKYGVKTKAQRRQGESIYSKFEPPFLIFSLGEVNGTLFQETTDGYFASYLLKPGYNSFFFDNHLEKISKENSLKKSDLRTVTIDIALNRKREPIYVKLTAAKPDGTPIKETTYTYVAKDSKVKIPLPDDLDTYKLVKKLF
ncbi:hypothetical protein LJC01_01105 [Clostridiaceae bacterium OttesenSCG-928-D20]|nr:hypothetical protein [Clostridiaceae bacterium OttesenSCG-928-D20]